MMHLGQDDGDSEAGDADTTDPTNSGANNEELPDANAANAANPTDSARNQESNDESNDESNSSPNIFTLSDNAKVCFASIVKHLEER